jgi:putative CocE/NonD family hydrolase
MRQMSRVLIVLIVALHVAILARGQEPLRGEAFIRANYTKQETTIPMRDGVKLFTSIYVPKDTSKTYPILIQRTPYSCSPYGPDAYAGGIGPSEHFSRAGYILVKQDVRGRFMSEGKFIQVTPHIEKKNGPNDVDESTDAYDTIEWLIKNIPNNNGRAGLYGISYPGFYSAAGMIDAHPALKAVSPQAPVADWYYDDFLHHGAFFLAHAFRWLNGNAQDQNNPTTERSRPQPLPTLDGYKMFLEAGTIGEINKRYLKDSVPFWNEMMAHPNRDEFWKKRNILPHLKNVAPAVMTVGGWYDAEDLYGTFNVYQAIEKQNPGVANTLVVGPWIHGGWAGGPGERLGQMQFASRTGEYYREQVEFPFFEKYLKDVEIAAPAEAIVFETGSNTWKTFEAWPPKEIERKKLYLRENFGLAYETPGSVESGADEYVSDPARPVPFTEQIATHMVVEYMVEDQRFASKRPDVLTYQTEPLTEDLTIAGAIPVDLWVATTAGDADFVVKLIDVFPDSTNRQELPGYQRMLRSEVFRGRFRNSYEKPEAFTPGEAARVRFDLLDTLHTFKKGHRLMVQIQSSWFPLVDRNPQKWVPNIYDAKPEDFQKATHTVFRTTGRPTSIELPILSAGK